MDTLAIELPLASNFLVYSPDYIIILYYTVYVCVCMYMYIKLMFVKWQFFLNIWQLASVSQAL